MSLKKIKFDLRLLTTGTDTSPDKVMTNDRNSVELVFNVLDHAEVDLANATTDVLLTMRDGSFFQNEGAGVVVGNTIRYKVKPREVRHQGLAKVQLVVRVGEIFYATGYYFFDILRGLNDEPVAKEIVITNWDNLFKTAQDYVKQFADNELARQALFDTNEGARQTAFVASEAIRETNESTRLTQEGERQDAEATRATSEAVRDQSENSRISAEAQREVSEGLRKEGYALIEEKAEKLENTYAPRLTTLEQNDVSLTSQLQQTEQSLNAQLAQKVGAGKLATMSDLGQEVKTAMTGGSVAVVGPNSTGNVNLINKQITPDKFTDVIEISRNDIPIHLGGAYMSATGPVTSADWNIRVLEIDRSVKSIDLIGVTVTDSSAFFKYPDGTITPILSRYFLNNITQHATLFINERISQPTTQVQSIRLSYTNYGATEPNLFNLVGEETLYGNGYIQNGIEKELITYAMYKIKIDTAYDYFGEFVGIAYGSLFNVENEYLREVSKNTNNVIDVSGASYMIVNVNPQTKIYAKRKNITEEMLTGTIKLLATAVNKPIDLQDKNIALFGDSIAQGNNGSGVYATTWFEQLCDKFGATGTNFAISGSMYTGANVGTNGIQSITNKIKNTNLSSYDIIFIAGGTNDATYNINQTTFRNTLADLYNYITLNSTAQVVVISPINRTRPLESGLKNINEFRNIIAEEVLVKKFNYINGSDLPFSDYVGPYQVLTMPDGLHPNQLGHDVYLNGVLSNLI